jgi:hypothetical protein
VSKKFGEWYQKTNKTEDTKKLKLLVFKKFAILHNTLLATFIKLLETVIKGLCTPLIWRPQAPSGEYGGLLSVPRLKSIMKGACFADVAAIQKRVTAVLRWIRKEAFADSFQKFLISEALYVANSVL